MATNSVELRASTSARVRHDDYPAGGVRFDLTAALLIGWFIVGLFLDGWAHNNGRVDNTFFTPWHAVLYSGVLAVGAFFTFTQTRNMLKGYRWSRSLPQGYRLALIGVIIFFAAGASDFVWHSLFGFESGVDALLSPSHLALATGAFLFITGPLRAGWNRPKAETKPGWAGLLPVVLALLSLFSLLTFFTQYANFFSNAHYLVATSQPPFFFEKISDAAGVLGVMGQAALTISLLLLAIRRWKLPFGSLTLILTINAVLMWAMNIGDMQPYWPILVAPLITGLFADYFLHRYQPTEHVSTFRLFGVLVPMLLFGLLFGMLMVIAGTWWSIHLWLGAIFMSGVIGLFVSYLLWPPRIPTD